jgi:hypothetical protein
VDQPTLDAQVLAQPFDVGNQMSGGVTDRSALGSLACGKLRPAPR